MAPPRSPPTGFGLYPSVWQALDDRQRHSLVAHAAKFTGVLIVYGVVLFLWTGFKAPPALPVFLIFGGIFSLAAMAIYGYCQNRFRRDFGLTKGSFLAIVPHAYSAMVILYAGLYQAMQNIAPVDVLALFLAAASIAAGSAQINAFSYILQLANTPSQSATAREMLATKFGLSEGEINLIAE